MVRHNSFSVTLLIVFYNADGLTLVTETFWPPLDNGLLRESVFKVITSWGQIEVAIQIIPYLLFPVICGIKYYTCWIKSTSMRKLLENIKLDWNMLQSKKEIEILKTYTAEGWFYGKIYAVYVFSSLVGFVTLLFVPFIMDAVIPANASRAEMLPFEAEYFIDMEGRYYYVILHVQTVAVVGITGIAAVDILYITVIFHACGLYTIVGYRLEHVFDDMQTIRTPRKVLVIRMRIRRAVKFHLKCLEYLNLGISVYKVSFVLQLFVIILAIAGLLFNVYLLLMSDQYLLAFAFIVDLMSHYFLLLINIIPGQRLADCSAELYFST
ncbi:hypothetical protein KM043_007902 [Ampulex compressa]|nr:hypothetical protein KM043_007902 [Ampulex compressa]